MKWYFMRGPGGTIACRGEYKAQAVTEAAERWGCDPAEISVTGEEPYNGNGEHCSPLQADRLSALQAGRLPALQKKDAAADGRDP